MGIVNWRVPQDVNLSQVKRCIGPAEHLYYIKVLNTEDYKEQAMNLVWQQIFESEPIISALHFDPESKESLRIWIGELLNQNVAYGCFSQPENYLVAVDLQHVRNESVIPNLERGEAFKRFVNYMNTIGRYIGFKTQIIHYLTSFGVFIMPSHRHLDDVDIQREMIQFRQSVAKALRLNITGSAFLGSEMQKMAQEIGYKQLKVFNYQDINLGLRLGCEEIFPITVMRVANKIKVEPKTRKILRPRTRRNQSAGTIIVQSKPIVEQLASDVDED